MAAQRKKTVPVGDRKGKKPANSPIMEHILCCPTPGNLEDKERREILKENLKRMGCAMLSDLPWRYTDEKILKEFIAQRSTSFLATIRAKPGDWTAEMWSQKWKWTAKGRGLPPKKENLAKDNFVATHSSKDGWKLSECKHKELRKVLEFLVPLINPNKPKRVTIWVASAVVDCLINKVKYSWAKSLRRVSGHR
jgi:hypothetical protein